MSLDLLSCRWAHGHLVKSLEEGTGVPGAPTFYRHGISATHRGKTVNLLICFQFGFLTADDDTPVYGVHGYGIGKSQEPVFDQLLQKAGVPLADKGFPPKYGEQP